MSRALEVEKIIRDRIMDGTYPSGRRLPSQPEMASEFKLAERTIGLVMAKLREQGYLYTLRYRGSYVNEKDHWPTELPDSSKSRSKGRNSDAEKALRIIRGRIVDGTYRFNKRMPGYNTLAAELGVSNRQIRKAISVLERGGYLRVSRPGGTFPRHRTKWGILEPIEGGEQDGT